MNSVFALSQGPRLVIGVGACLQAIARRDREQARSYNLHQYG